MRRRAAGILRPQGLNAASGAVTGAGAPWVVSKAEFARLMGVAKSMVSKWLGNGSLGPGARQDGRIDVRLACSNLGRPMPAAAPMVPRADFAAAWAMGAPQTADADDADDDPEALDPDALLQVRLSTQRLALRRQELDLAEREGRLVDAAAAAAETERLARELRGQIMLVPGDVADLCVGQRAGDIELIIARALESALMRASG